MTDYYIKGNSSTYRPSGGGGSSDLSSMRVELALGTQSVVNGTGDTTIVWPNAAVWDDIGFPDTYYTYDGLFLFGAGMDGEYLVTVYAQLDPTSGFTGGMAEIEIDNGGLIEHQSTPLIITSRPKMSASSVHRFYEGEWTAATIRMNSASDTSVVWYASMTITKLRSIPPA